MTFPSTAWSMLEHAKSPDQAEVMAAMNRFIVGYWRPIYRFLRAKGLRHETAEDLTQEFLLKFLDRDWLAKADASRGRFRNYLLSILKRFVADQGCDRAPRQRAFDQGLVPVSALVRDEERAFEPLHHELPEDVLHETLGPRWSKRYAATWRRGAGNGAGRTGTPSSRPIIFPRQGTRAHRNRRWPNGSVRRVTRFAMPWNRRTRSLPGSSAPQLPGRSHPMPRSTRKSATSNGSSAAESRHS